MIKNSKGFTLIELLAVIIIVVAVGTIITATLVIALRSANKSNTITDVRQSGNYAISQMAKMLTYAKSFDGVSDGSLDNSGNLIYTTTCTPPIPQDARYSYIKISSFDGGQTTFFCDSANNQIASQSATGASVSLIPSGKSLPACYFTCAQTSTAVSPIIGIDFTLQKSTSSVFSENQTIIPFETTVTFRNY